MKRIDYRKQVETLHNSMVESIKELVIEAGGEIDFTRKDKQDVVSCPWAAITSLYNCDSIYHGRIEKVKLNHETGHLLLFATLFYDSEKVGADWYTLEDVVKCDLYDLYNESFDYVNK